MPRRKPPRSGRNDFGRDEKGLAALTRGLEIHLQEHPKLRVLLECAGELPFGEAVKLLDAVRAAGVKEIGFSGR